MAEAPTLMSARILVVGASSGIGRAFARSALAQGAEVCAMARRGDRLDALCAEAGRGHPMVGDVTDPETCRRVVGEAAETMGGLDLVFYSAGSGAMTPINAADADAWRSDHAVNVLGPTLVCGAALPLMADDGLVAFVSSISASRVMWGLSSYASSKAALDATVQAWRHEHPERRFQRIVLGPTVPTDFGHSFDPGVLATALDRWSTAGVSLTFMDTEDVGRHLAELMAVFLAHPYIDVPDLFLEARGEAWRAAAGGRHV